MPPRGRGYDWHAMVMTVKEAGSKRWKDISAKEHKNISAKGGKNTWANLTADERSAEMKRRAKVRKKNAEKSSPPKR